MRTVHRNGKPLLYLPDDPAAAISTLKLYPAQRPRARVARTLLKLALFFRFPLPLATAAPPTLEISSVHWLKDLPDINRISPGNLGVFAGNSEASGRRYLFLLCDKKGEPLFLAKVGFDAEAIRKIELEKEFLRNRSLANVPELLGVIETATSAGLLFPFIGGRNPNCLFPGAMLQEVLAGWISPAVRPSLGDIPAWQSISSHVDSWNMEDHRVSAVIGHGDFAPWNILVDRQNKPWVIDWERGSDCWVPGWDQFHYMVQTAILVRRLSPHGIINRAAAMLHQPAFAEYARKTGIRGFEEYLFRGYLIHAHHVLGQTEGAETMRELAEWARRI